MFSFYSQIQSLTRKAFGDLYFVIQISFTLLFITFYVLLFTLCIQFITLNES